MRAGAVAWGVDLDGRLIVGPAHRALFLVPRPFERLPERIALEPLTEEAWREQAERLRDVMEGRADARVLGALTGSDLSGALEVRCTRGERGVVESWVEREAGN